MSSDNQSNQFSGFDEFWHRALVVSFPEDPMTAPKERWKACSVDTLKRQGRWPLRPDWNNYFCVSLFHGERRIAAEFKALCVLAVDDVGVKVDTGLLLDRLGTPAWAIETSPGNQQWFWFLRPWVTDLAKARALVRLVQGNDACDVTRLMRLPEGTNTKASLGKPFPTRVVVSPAVVS